MEPVGRSPCKLTFDHIELRRSVTLQPVQFWSEPSAESSLLELCRGEAQNVQLVGQFWSEPRGNLFVKPKAEAKIIWVMLRREKDY
jgi:hypothetical protein